MSARVYDLTERLAERAGCQCGVCILRRMVDRITAETATGELLVDAEVLAAVVADVTATVAAVSAAALAEARSNPDPAGETR